MAKKMTYEQKFNRAKEQNINLPEILLEERNLVGVYKFFKVDGDKRHCFYVGKATNLKSRILDDYIRPYLNRGNSKHKKLVPSKLYEYIVENKYTVDVEIIEIDYYDTLFTNAVHRLALAELQEIVKYQGMEQCEFQSTEGVGKYEKDFWEENYRLEQKRI